MQRSNRQLALKLALVSRSLRVSGPITSAILYGISLGIRSGIMSMQRSLLAPIARWRRVRMLSLDEDNLAKSTETLRTCAHGSNGGPLKALLRDSGNRRDKRSALASATRACARASMQRRTGPASALSGSAIATSHWAPANGRSEHAGGWQGLSPCRCWRGGRWTARGLL